MEQIEITIINWEKYNPQDFQTRYPHWFRLNKDLLQSSSIFELSYEHRWIWIGLLCLACEKKNKTIIGTKKWFCHRLQVSTQAFDSAIEILFTANSLAIDCHKTPNLSPPTEQNKTEQDKKILFNFEEIYKAYPRREGKTRGLAALSKTVKTPEQFTSLQTAVKNYANRCAAENIEHRFIKLFSTFANEWQDWISPEPVKSTKRKVIHGAEKLF